MNRLIVVNISRSQTEAESLAAAELAKERAWCYTARGLSGVDQTAYRHARAISSRLGLGGEVLVHPALSHINSSGGIPDYVPVLEGEFRHRDFLIVVVEASEAHTLIARFLRKRGHRKLALPPGIDQAAAMEVDLGKGTIELLGVPVPA